MTTAEERAQALDKAWNLCVSETDGDLALDHPDCSVAGAIAAEIRAAVQDERNRVLDWIHLHQQGMPTGENPERQDSEHGWARALRVLEKEVRSGEHYERTTTRVQSKP